ncbi:hypothetical protein Ccrd_004474 [Cynara cardunculus var. scolymus]|uniref:Uncharacterized protein n=1 Tax=Cynara cardunculus var. scolymus TaxID=59895 RepID=A0A118JVS5_CYNCS|nr:hypothetical protein Ccrd_004474 [Cynara cardunculus var. scolymus]
MEKKRWGKMLVKLIHLYALLAPANQFHLPARCQANGLKTTVEQYTTAFAVAEPILKHGKDMTTASRAARARISAQETTPGQAVSICNFAASITSNPTKERLGGAVLSVDGPESSTDASQPKTKQSWKNILSKPAATAGLLRKAD